MLLNIDMETARNLLLNSFQELGGEWVKLEQAAGRIAYRPVTAGQELPPVKQSAVDGYAWYLKDIPAEWLNLGLPGKPGQTIFVKTGEMVPTDYQAVAPLEKCQLRGQVVQLTGPLMPGDNLRWPGEDIALGELVLERGMRLTAGRLAALAALGVQEILVYRQPRVAILTLSPGVIRDSNSVMLAALIQRDGGLVTVRGVNDLPGERELAERVRQWLQHTDMLITIGSTFGDPTLNGVIQHMGASCLFKGTKFHPGGHNSGFNHRGQPIISLSGNPAACLVGYELLVSPLLKQLQGQKPLSCFIIARCESGSYQSRMVARKFIRGRLAWRDDGWMVTILPGQKPSMIKSLLDYNCLIEVPTEQQAIEPGDSVRVYPVGQNDFWI